MTDPVVRSAANTLRTWKMRQEAKGKPPSPDRLRERLRELWPDLTDAQTESILLELRP